MLINNCWETYLGEPPRDSLYITSAILGDARVLAAHINEGTEPKDGDNKLITPQGIRAHPGFSSEIYPANKYCKSHTYFKLGDLVVDWIDEEPGFEFYHKGDVLHPSPVTWGDLDAFAKILKAKLVNNHE